MKLAERSNGKKEEWKPEELERVVTHLLEECRMVLPGIQAIFGFQLIAVFNNGFGQKLSVGEQYVHLVSVGLIVLSIAALLAPAAYHRIAEMGRISARFVKLASVLLGVGMFFLMVGMSVDLYLIARIILNNVAGAACVAGGAVVVIAGLWFGYPMVRRERIGNGK